MKTTILHLINAVTCAGAVLLMAVPAKAQNLYFPGVNGNIVEMTTAGGTNIVVDGPISKGIDGLVFDSAGDLFIGTPLDIDEITNGTANVVRAFGDEIAISGLAFNSAGDLFAILNEAVGYGFIGEYTPETAPGFQNFYSFAGSGEEDTMAFDRSGNLFFLGHTNEFFSSDQSDLIEITAAGSTNVLATNSFFNSATALCLDSAGNVYLAENSSVGVGASGNIWELSTNGTQSIFMNFPTNTPVDMAFDSAGDMFVTAIYKTNDTGVGCILKITPGGAVNTLLPGAIGYGTGRIGYFIIPLAFEPVPDVQGQLINNTFQLTVRAPSPYYTTILQSSPDLVNWNNVYTNTPPFTFTDCMVAANPARFYRAVDDTNFFYPNY